MIKEKLKLDDRDDIIIQMLQKNPQTSQEEIAKVLKLSQPSVWARIRNLKQRGIISNIVGMDFKTVDLHLAKVDVSCTDTQAIIDEFKDCPYFLNALITSGRYNVCLLFTGTDLKNIEGMVNHHLRGNPKVKDIELNIVISTANNFVMPLNIDYNNKNQMKCKKECKDCID
ncbi:Lrp/AsnC family transcriptional regulator [Candidatus Woesearchaeota archaeon]|nr:Lrp/AsnC family transcriptional regulator [Candidatus Woesearchaeota archaeon]